MCRGTGQMDVQEAQRFPKSLMATKCSLFCAWVSCLPNLLMEAHRAALTLLRAESLGIEFLSFSKSVFSLLSP